MIIDINGDFCYNEKWMENSKTISVDCIFLWDEFVDYGFAFLEDTKFILLISKD